MVSIPRADAPRARGDVNVSVLRDDRIAARDAVRDRDIGRALIIPAVDGFPLGATVFEPSHPRATIVIHGATAVPHRYYAAFAEHLAVEHGFRVVTYDYRGVGASRPAGGLRGFDATMTDWAQKDARAIHAWARDRGQPLAMITHSFGGQMIGLLDELREVEVALVVASQLGWYRDWPLLSRLRLGVTWHVATPIVTGAFGYLPGAAGLGVDLPKGVAREWARWCTSPGYLTDHHADAADRFARWDRPTLLLSFSDDDYGPPRAIDALARRISGGRFEHRAWQPGEYDLDAVGHFGFFRASHAVLWPDAIAFVNDALGGRDPRRDALRLDELEQDLRYGRP